NSDDDDLDLFLADERRQILCVAKDGQTVNDPAMLGGVIIGETHRPQLPAGIVPKLPSQNLAAGASTHDQHPLHARFRRISLPSVRRVAGVAAETLRRPLSQGGCGQSERRSGARKGGLRFFHIESLHAHSNGQQEESSVHRIKTGLLSAIARPAEQAGPGTEGQNTCPKFGIGGRPVVPVAIRTHSTRHLYNLTIIVYGPRRDDRAPGIWSPFEFGLTLSSTRTEHPARMVHSAPGVMPPPSLSTYRPPG